jgi:hypothetical protein
MEKKMKKKLLLLSDDIRTPSGVAHISKNILLGISDEYDTVQIGAMPSHPGKSVEMFENIKIYPSSGYGNKGLVNKVMQIEKPDYLMIFTDPRYWTWLFRFEDEIRAKVPLLYYHLWDNYPVPLYNEKYFKSVDWVGYINKLSGDIVKKLDSKFENEKWRTKYIPHGVDENVFKPIKADDNVEYKNFINQYFNVDDAFEKYDFRVIWNNRNIKRKQAIDVLYGFKLFLDSIEDKKRERCLLILHTSPSDEHGTDLKAVVRDLMPEYLENIAFSTTKMGTKYISYLYNFADVTINLANNEGYGLSNAESLMSGTMTITTVTGGLQDQLGIVYENGSEIYDEEVWIDGKIPKEVGKWSIPLWPTSRTLNGSVPTPYIYEDRVDIKNYTLALIDVYNMGKKERDFNGLLGREYLLKNGHSNTKMIENIKSSLVEIDKNWKPIQNRVYLSKI